VRCRLWNAVANLLDPTGVVQHNEDVVVDLVFGEEDRIAGAPLLYLLMDHIGLGSDEVARLNLEMLQPHGGRFNVAIIIVIRVEDEDVELGVGKKAKLGRCLHSLYGDLVLRLGDIRL